MRARTQRSRDADIQHRLRRVVTLLAGVVALLLGSWVAVPATAGGPTSVLLVAPASGRAAALHTTGGSYQRLVAALDAYAEPTGSTTPPSKVDADCFTCEIRLTWLVHDVQVWRIDRVHRTTDDGIWIETVAGFDADLAARTGRWHRPHDEAALSAILTETGVIVASNRGGAGRPSVSPSPAPNPPRAGAELGGSNAGAPSSETPGPPTGVVAAIAGAVGLAAGAALSLLVRRSRAGDQRVQLIG